MIGFDDYDPFGNVLPGRSYNAGTPNDLNKFTGHERDQEGGLDLDYMLARNYDSELGRFYSVDPLASKFPAWSPYNYTMNNPLRFVDPDGKAPDDPFNITVRTFIPYKSIAGFHGDGRSATTNPNASYRTSHTIGVETNPIVSQNPETSNDGGKTGLTYTAFGIPPTGLPVYGKATEGAEGGFQASVSRSVANGGDNAVINFTGSSRNPLTPGGPKIDYNFSITIIPGQDGANPTISVSGTHDGFPAYEINIKDGEGNTYQVYNDAPNSKWELVRLVGSSDTKVE